MGFLWQKKSDYAAAAVAVTVTLSVSPFCTERAAEKSPSPRSVPVVPPFVLLSAMNAPRTVRVALMLKTAFAAELSTDPPEIVPGVKTGRVAFEYGVPSVHPAWEDMMSPAA